MDITKQSLSKSFSYPIHPSRMRAYLDDADATAIESVVFSNFRGRALVEARFQGKARNNSSAGQCTIHINAIPRKKFRELESLFEEEVLSKLIEWYQKAEGLTSDFPKDLSYWEVTYNDGRFSFDVHFANNNH